MMGRVCKSILAFLLVVSIVLSSSCRGHKQTALDKIEKSKAFSYKNIEHVLESNDFTTMNRLGSIIFPSRFIVESLFESFVSGASRIRI